MDKLFHLSHCEKPHHKTMTRKSLLLALVMLLSACARQTPLNAGNTNNLYNLQHLSTGDGLVENTDGVNKIRRKALEETAMSIGAQSGLAARGREIDNVLKSHSKQLDSVYNFHAMLLNHNVLPPVLIESRSSLNMADPNSLRLADRSYAIAQQAKFINAPPNWRDYLMLSFTQPSRPHDTLLPRNAMEQIIWDHAVTHGWDQGIQQANTIFNDNLAKLTRDYNGMVLYRTLLAQKMVSAPFVARTKLGITGGGSKLRINDQVLRITALPQLQADSKQWQPAVSYQKPNYAPLAKGHKLPRHTHGKFR